MRRLGPNQRKLMNAMIDIHSISELAEMTGLEAGAIRESLDALIERDLVAKLRGGIGRYALTHSGKRMVR